MGIRKRFNEVFGLQDGIEEERERFVARVNQAVFGGVYHELADSGQYKGVFASVCFELGIDARTFPSEVLGNRVTHPQMDVLTKGDFNKTLEVLCALHERIRFRGGTDEGRKWLSDMINEILSRCTCDIGVRWKDGLFYPSGAEQLDKPLIEDVLIWLRDYPKEEKDYRTALRHYMAGDPLADVVKDCYSAVEGIARSILGNTKNLDNNKELLLTKIGLSEGWKRLLATYINYAQDYRHASEIRHDITKQEAEAYLYMTGLIIRLTIESKKS